MSEYTESIPDETDQMDQDQLQPENNLDDRGVDDFLDEGYSPPERPSALIRKGEHETLDERLDEEVPEDDEDVDAASTVDLNTADLSNSDVSPDNLSVDDLSAEDLDDGEVGDERAGRLVDPNEGIGADIDSELVGDEVGIDGAAASAEEAAVHIVEEP